MSVMIVLCEACSCVVHSSGGVSWLCTIVRSIIIRSTTPLQELKL